jgi:ketosteroid isomerase-like protein
MSTEQVELARETFHAFRTNGVEAALPFLALDVVWYTTDRWIEESAYHGHDGIRRLNAAFDENFDDWTYEVHDFRDAQDCVVVRAEMIGRIKNSGQGINQPLGLVVSRFGPGTIGEIRAFANWQQALEAAGLEG